MLRFQTSHVRSKGDWERKREMIGSHQSDYKIIIIIEFICQILYVDINYNDQK